MASLKRIYASVISIHISICFYNPAKFQKTTKSLWWLKQQNKQKHLLLLPWWVQWLGLWTQRGMGSIPGRGTKIPHIWSMAKKKKKKTTPCLLGMEKTCLRVGKNNSFAFFKKPDINIEQLHHWRTVTVQPQWLQTFSLDSPLTISFFSY